MTIDKLAFDKILSLMQYKQATFLFRIETTTLKDGTEKM